jgi:hypothetical protein
MLPNGASRTDIMRTSDSLQKYISKNAKCWYQYADVPNGSLYVITGVDKCDSWELVAFHNPSYDREDFTFQITVNNPSAASLAGSLTHTSVLPNCSVGQRASLPHSGEGSGHNQAVFLRGFKISIPERAGTRSKVPVKLASLEDSTFESIKAQGESLSFSPGIPISDFSRPLSYKTPHTGIIFTHSLS